MRILNAVIIIIIRLDRISGAMFSAIMYEIVLC
jgi:hypothetical protein